MYETNNTFVTWNRNINLETFMGINFKTVIIYILKDKISISMHNNYLYIYLTSYSLFSFEKFSTLPLKSPCENDYHVFSMQACTYVHIPVGGAR